MQTEQLRRDTARLEDLKVHAEAAEATKSQFVANTSHELRTPLHGIIGLLQHMRDEELSAEQQECTDTALQQAGEILSVLNRVLDAAKVRNTGFSGASKPDSEHSPFNGVHCVLDAGKVTPTTCLQSNSDSTA